MMQNDFCTYCGKGIDRKDRGAVSLSDGKRLCGSCAALARIAYPRALTWASVISESKLLDLADCDEDMIWIDPLESMTAGQLSEAIREAGALRKARREELGGAAAYFRVFENSRAISDLGMGRRMPKNEFYLRGISLLGDVPAGRACVRRREGAVYFDIKRVETAAGDSVVPSEAAFIPEGCTGRIVLGEDVPVYPGDVIEIG